LRKTCEAIKKDNFYTSVSKLYKNNDGRTTVCQDCIKELFNQYTKTFEDKVTALYHICARFDWYFSKKILSEIDEGDTNFLSTYLRRTNLGLNRVKTFIDTLTECGGIGSNDSIIQNTILPASLTERSLDNSSVEKEYSNEWVGEYTVKERDYLDKYYAGLRSDYKIITENHRDYARKIAKASLYMDICFEDMMKGEKGAEIQYNKARETFDKLCQSAKFAESSRSINDVGLGSFGKIFEQVENEEYIYKHVPIKKDEIDEMLAAFQTIQKSL